MVIKILTVPALLLIFEISFSQQYWLNIPSPTTKDLYKCHLIDTLNGWAAGELGVIINTSNGGQNWNVQNSGIDYMIDDIFFINKRLGWAVANDFLFFGTNILRTSNGGINWTNSRFPDTTKVFNVVYFLDSATGFLTGYTGQILKTTNAGFSWNECRIDTLFCPILFLFPKWDLVFMNSTTGFACGGQIDIQGIVWRTTDSGLNWFTYCVAPEPLLEIKAINQSKVVATGGDPDYGVNFVKSYDAGLTWNYHETGLFGIGRSLAYRTPSELWVPGSFLQKFAVNLDSGNSSAGWLEINPPAQVNLNAAQFVTPTYGWAFGGSGTILKYNSAIIGIGSLESQIPVGFKLSQNFPNPFNPVSVIRFEIPELDGDKFVNLSIFDVLGKLVSEPVNGLMEAGVYSVDFDGSNKPSGVYFYVLTLKTDVNNVYRLTKKMALLK